MDNPANSQWTPIVNERMTDVQPMDNQWITYAGNAMLTIVPNARSLTRPRRVPVQIRVVDVERR